MPAFPQKSNRAVKNLLDQAAGKRLHMFYLIAAEVFCASFHFIPAYILEQIDQIFDSRSDFKRPVPADISGDFLLDNLFDERDLRPSFSEIFLNDSA